MHQPMNNINAFTLLTVPYELNQVNSPQNKVTDISVVGKVGNMSSHQLFYCFTHSNRNNTDVAAQFFHRLFNDQTSTTFVYFMNTAS